MIYRAYGSIRITAGKPPTFFMTHAEADCGRFLLCG
jgi:hypothetical protein